MLCGGGEGEGLHIEVDTLLSWVCEVGSLADSGEKALHIEDVLLFFAREAGNLAESGEEVMMHVGVCFLALHSSLVVQMLSLSASHDT